MSRLLATLAVETGLNIHDVRAIARNAPVRYKIFHIPKRSGGTRLISQPAREVKALQKALVSEVLRHQPVHTSATAYRAGKSIKYNAEIHASNSPILKFDFKDFFSSIRDRDWHMYCETTSLFDDPEDIHLSTKILFHQMEGSSALRLAIGAPSSPCLSNILMNTFDTKIASLVAKDYVTYTRYADDLTFSARRTGFLVNVEKTLRQVVRELKSPSLTINEQKTVMITQKYRRSVTGLVLTNDGLVSIGHERKRNIRAALHHAEQGKLAEAEKARLGGLIAFAQSIEPEFLKRLIKRYGADLIADVKASSKSMR